MALLLAVFAATGAAKALIERTRLWSRVDVCGQPGRCPVVFIRNRRTGTLEKSKFTPRSFCRGPLELILVSYQRPNNALMPEVVPIIVESPEPSGPFGAKGVGEPALIPTAPAILNAIADALGARIYALPANLERVLAASIAAGHFKPAP